MSPFSSIPLLLFLISSLISLSFCQSNTNTTVWPPYLSNLTQLQCNNLNVEASSCTMQGSVSSGFVWDQPNSTIEFTGFVANLRGIQNCQIFIRARNVWFEHSNISGCDIIIEASLSVKMDNSLLSVDGSQTLGPGYVDDSDVGNSYAGAGGYCGAGLAPDNSYGDFATSYDDDSDAFGTGGSNSYSAGGGRIVIITTEFSAIGSALSANGFPQYCLSNQTSTKGGTGGYIYLNAASTLVPYQQNSISAQGGLGCDNSSLGGSGGRVIISADPGLGNKFNVSINGGEAQTACATGASGTLYCQNYSTAAPNALFVTQNPQNGLTIPTPTYVNLAGRDNLNLTIMGGPSATIAVQTPETDAGAIELLSIMLFSESRLIYWLDQSNPDQSDAELSMSIANVLSVEHSEIWCNCDLNLQVQYMMAVSKHSFISSGAADSTINLNATMLILENSAILFSETSPLLQFQQIDPLNSDSTDSSDDSSPSDVSDFSDFSDGLYEQLTNVLFANGSLSMTSLIVTAGPTTISSAYIQADFIYLNVDNLIHDGSIIATTQTCTGQSLPVRTQTVNPVLYNLDLDQMASAYSYQDPITFVEDSIFQDYTVIVIVQEQAQINGIIQGSRIGLFANQLNISETGTVTAAGLGCPSNQGPGFGLIGADLGTTCASTGGSYGAVGGLGQSIGSAESVTQCLSQVETVPVIYGDPQNPLYEGSGGGSYNDTLGGSGGGVIILGALNSLYVQGTVNASGTVPNGIGAGAGAGGSVQLYMNQLLGTGAILANGGGIPEGSLGGVGGGGRISISFLEWSQILLPNDSPVFPSILVSPGAQYGATEATTVNQINIGQQSLTLSGTGSLSSSPCPPGYFGLFCEPCNGSVFKSDFSSNECHECIIPTGAVLTNQFAQQSYICDFTCEYEVTYVGTRICVSNMVIYNIHQGGVFGGLFAIGAAVVVALYFTVAIILKKKEKKVEQKSASISTSDLSLTDFKMKGKYFTNSHVQRINIFGDNTPESRWFINTDTLNLRELDQIRDKIDHLIKSINRTTGWKKTWVLFLKFFVIAYPPIYFFLLQKFRGKLYRRIKTLVKEINHELTEYCVLRSLPIYYVSINVDKCLSSGYLDLFQDDGNFSERNNLLPVSITLTGNGNFCSPYRIDKNDAMLEHLVVSWGPKNCAVAEDEITYFRYELRRFITKFNKKVKYIDYSASSKTFQEKLSQTINEVNKFKEIFENEYSLYFNLFAFEIPRFVMDETYAIQPLLQSPVRVTILEDSKGQDFIDLASRLQKRKTEDEFDVKLYLIVNSDRDLQGVSQKVQKRTTSVFPTEEREEIRNSNNCQPKTTDLEELKQGFYKKLDDISFNIEYSIPRQIALANPGLKKKQKMSSARKKVYATSRKYFKILHRIFHALVGFKQSQKCVVRIYVTMGILILINLCFLWFRAVSIFELNLSSYLWTVFFPFPFVMVISPLFGLLGVMSRNRRMTFYFGLFNSCCLINQAVSFAIVASISEDSTWTYIYEVLSCLFYLITLFVCKYLLPLQK